MRKSHAMGIGAILAAATVLAEQPVKYVEPMIMEGSNVIQVDGTFESDGNRLGFDLNAAAGHFIQDFLEVGGYASAGMLGNINRKFALGGQGEYHFDLGTLFVPYIGGRLGLGYWKMRDRRVYDFDARRSEDRSYDNGIFVEAQGHGGLRFFFADHAAVGLQVALQAASRKIYNDGQDAFNWKVQLVTGFYY